MDDEDRRDAEEARKIETDRGFLGIGSDPQDPAMRHSLPALISLLAPTIHDTMGAQLLRKMGWIEGQGVGPKVKRRANDTDKTPKSTDTCNGTSKMHLLAPVNPPIVRLERRCKPTGLGYVVETELKDNNKDTYFTSKKPSSTPRGTHGTAFGVGILNDDEEDEDPYEIRPKSCYNKTIDTNKPDNKRRVTSQPLGKHTFISSKASKAKTGIVHRKCHDGRVAITGFVLAASPVTQRPLSFPPVQVPTDWQPVVSLPPVDSRHAQSAGIGSKLDPRARGSLLGEAPLPGKSVFDYLTVNARDRIASLTGKGDLPPALGEAASSSARQDSPLKNLVPRMDKAVALSALEGGFMPYADDTEKQHRYRMFLEVQAGIKDGLPDRVGFRAIHYGLLFIPNGLIETWHEPPGMGKRVE